MRIKWLLPRKREIPTWQTESGTIINIPDLDNEHLINIIKYLKRYAFSMRIKIAAHLGQTDVDMFQYYLDKLNQLSDHNFLMKYYPPYKDLFAEYTKRNLKNYDYRTYFQQMGIK